MSFLYLKIYKDFRIRKNSRSFSFHCAVYLPIVNRAQSDVTAHFFSLQLFHNVDWPMRKSWAGANEDCQTRGGSLVSILNYEEEEFLALYTKGSTKWIGLKRNAVEGGEYNGIGDDSEGNKSSDCSHAASLAAQDTLGATVCPSLTPTGAMASPTTTRAARSAWRW